MPVKLGFIILSIIGVLRIPEEFYLYKDKDKEYHALCKLKKSFYKSQKREGTLQQLQKAKRVVSA